MKAKVIKSHIKMQGSAKVKANKSCQLTSQT